ncbi:MAG: QueT transporter family protein [Acetobacteraceae bacterium]|nr:QueT transporter family protein [Acetobacteraceae bacterium]
MKLLQDLARVALVAALYAALTVALGPLSYGPLFQLRVAEALTVLPYVTPLAVWGLFLGCIAANFFGGLGAYDIVFGSLATLIAAALTSRAPRAWLAPLPPVVVNAVIVGWYLSVLVGVPFWVTAGYVALGEAIACYGLGYPLLLLVRTPALSRLLRGR